jgi:ADP-ribose pyrophosphatase YjhB (NUDIX family)
LSLPDSRRYPRFPLLGVGAVLIEAGAVLLIERGQPPLEGSWTLPGGLVESGESLTAALVREMLEETGLEVEPLELVTLFERVTPDACGAVEYHFVIADYLCRLRGGRLAPASDARRAEWVRREALGGYALAEGTLAVLERAFTMWDALRR